jgi:hypothetical protein
VEPATSFNDLITCTEDIGPGGLNEWEPEDLTGPITFTRQFLARKQVEAHHATAWVGVGDDEKTPAFVYQIYLETDAEHTACLESELFAALSVQDFAAERDGRVVIGLCSRTKSIADADHVE